LQFLLLPKNIFAALTFSSAPSQITEEQEFEVNVNITNLTQETPYFLRAVFYQPGTTNYFGYTWNGSDWYNGTPSPIDYTKFLSIQRDSSGNWSGTLKAKPDPASGKYSGPGLYEFKIGRYTSAGSLSWSSTVAQIQITQSAQTPTAVPVSTKSPSQNPSAVELSEFMPNPEDGKEWVEVHNPSGQAADISGYKIDDIEGSSSPFTIPPDTLINPGAYFVFYFEQARFNNEGDTVRLLDPSGQVKDSYTYSDSQKGISFAKDRSGFWQQTSTPTPGSANKITIPQVESAGTTAKSSGKTSSKSEGQTSKSESKEAGKSGSTAKTANTSQVLSLTEATLPAVFSATQSSLPQVTDEARVKSSNVNFLAVFFLITAAVVFWGSVAFRFWKKRK